jgi:predicted AAA+ superfamily ATPase
LVSNTESEKIETIREITNSYLFKDILAFDRVKSSRVILNLVKLLAFQIGSQVSLNELATQVEADTKTVARYLDLLEKSFVIIRLNGFSRNLRQEVTSKSKYYFFDNGIRNAVIAISILWTNAMILGCYGRILFFPKE